MAYLITYLWTNFLFLIFSPKLNALVSIDEISDAKSMFMFRAEIDIFPPSIKSSAFSPNLNSYVLHWEQTKNKSEVNYYYLRYRPMKINEWNYTKILKNFTSYTFKNLSSETTYTLELMSVCSADIYSVAAIFKFQTGNELESYKEFEDEEDRTVPPAPSPTTDKISATSVYINWVPKVNGKYPVLYYKLLKKVANNNFSKWVLIDDKISAMSTSYQVDNLQPSVTYSFHLIAINKYGDSAPGYASTKIPKRKQPNRYIIPPELIDVMFVQNNTKLKIKWKYDGDVKDIYQFEIIYEELNYKNPEKPLKKKKRKNCFVVSLDSREYFWDSIRPKKLFQIKMKAHSRLNGLSPDSNLFQCNKTKCVNVYEIWSEINKNSTWEDQDRDLVFKIKEPEPVNYDMAYFITGMTLGFVVLILAISGIVYRHKLTDQRKRFELEDKNFHHQVCDKVVNHLRKSQQNPPVDLFSKSCSNHTNSLNNKPESNCSSLNYRHKVKSEEQEKMLDMSLHCAATGVAQLPWANDHVF